MQFEVRRNWLGRPERWYTAEEVSHHITPDDLWLVAHGKVYDATGWVEMHPGGAAALLRRGGLDATRDFDFHTKRAHGLWEATCIGKLEYGRPADWLSWFSLCRARDEPVCTASAGYRAEIPQSASLYSVLSLMSCVTYRLRTPLSALSSSTV